jgi:hypothetical protein
MWADDVDDDAPLAEERIQSFVLDVVGRCATNPPGKYAFERTSTGWTQRFMEGDADVVNGFNHDYVSGETMEELGAWWRIDFARATVTVTATRELSPHDADSDSDVSAA